MRKIIDPLKQKAVEDILDREVEKPSDLESVDTSIDDLLKAGLQAIKGTMRSIMADVGTGAPSRETVQNLKDIMGMLKDLKKDEKEFLDNLSDEDLEKLSKK